MTISGYRDELAKRNPCSEGMDAFNKCRSRKDFFEVIGKPVACDYFLQSIRDGWGPSSSDFENIFFPYINGKHTIVSSVGDRTIRSQIWCNSDNIKTDDSVRWLILLGCNGKVTIRGWHVVKIFVDSNSFVDIESSDSSVVYVETYGGIVNDLNNNCKIIVK